MADLQLGYFLK